MATSASASVNEGQIGTPVNVQSNSAVSAVASTGKGNIYESANNNAPWEGANEGWGSSNAGWEDPNGGWISGNAGWGGNSVQSGVNVN